MATVRGRDPLERPLHAPPMASPPRGDAGTPASPEEWKKCLYVCTMQEAVAGPDRVSVSPRFLDLTAKTVVVLAPQDRHTPLGGRVGDPKWQRSAGGPPRTPSPG